MDNHRLSTGDRHLLRLVNKGKQDDGWAPVSSVVLPLIQELPEELRELKENDGHHFVRLTEKGEAVVFYA